MQKMHPIPQEMASYPILSFQEKNPVCVHLMGLAIVRLSYASDQPRSASVIIARLCFFSVSLEGGIPLSHCLTDLVRRIFLDEVQTARARPAKWSPAPH